METQESNIQLTSSLGVGHVYKRAFLTVCILFSLLSVVNMIYLSLILKLKQKSFHLMMFTMLQICYCSKIIYSFEFIYEKAVLAAISRITNYLTDEIVHSIFAMKYWVLSRKIRQFIDKKEDKLLDCKARTIFSIQMLLILSTGFAMWFYLFNKLQRVKLFQAFLTLPPYISFSLLAHALYKLRGCGGDKYSLSTSQIFIQLSAGFLYALSNTFAYYFFNEATFYITTSLDCLSLFVLTSTLCHVANLQIKQQRNENGDQTQLVYDNFSTSSFKSSVNSQQQDNDQTGYITATQNHINSGNESQSLDETIARSDSIRIENTNYSQMNDEIHGLINQSEDSEINQIVSGKFEAAELNLFKSLMVKNMPN